MNRAKKHLTSEQVRALIKQAIGIITGDPRIVAEATAEIAAIQDARPSEKPGRGGHRRRTKAPPSRGP